ncbi:hypothetical protein [Belnapia moabensis]|uniref:hypothetical protein n=1 Tax=Belnapia moabensis TaxID=365533 RepID=UPI0012EE4081|nr:hypothetical protein [Belnapia moabensis]
MTFFLLGATTSSTSTLKCLASAAEGEISTLIQGTPITSDQSPCHASPAGAARGIQVDLLAFGPAVPN